MLKIIVVIFVMLFCFCTEASGQSYFPISVVASPAGLPLAVLVGMESKPGKFIVFQVDTGAPHSFVFDLSSNLGKFDDRLEIISIGSEKPKFLGDSGGRALVRLKSEISDTEEYFSVVSVPFATPQTGGVIGVSWFFQKEIQLSFDKMFLSVNNLNDSKGKLFSAADNRSKNIQINKETNRIYATVCRSRCESMIIDTGVTIADVVEFVSPIEFSARVSSDDVIQMPGVLGAVKCRLPSRMKDISNVGGVKVANLYETICMFLESPESIPDKRVLGIRSLIESKGSLYLNTTASIVKFNYGLAGNVK